MVASCPGNCFLYLSCCVLLQIIDFDWIERIYWKMYMAEFKDVLLKEPGINWEGIKTAKTVQEMEACFIPVVGGRVTHKHGGQLKAALPLPICGLLIGRCLSLSGCLAASQFLLCPYVFTHLSHHPPTVAACGHRDIGHD